MQLTNQSSNYVNPPEGVHAAVCVDVIDLGLQETNFGPKQQVRLNFELEAKMDDGKPFTCGKSFTASLNAKATLAKFLAKWRGKPIAEGESLDLEKLIGQSCTLVLGPWTSADGQKSGVGIDAVSKPSKKLAPSGHYDPKATRQRIKERQDKYGKPVQSAPATAPRPKDKHKAPADDDVSFGDAPVGTEAAGKADDVGF